MMEPVRLNDLVHYVSHGTPVKSDGTQAYRSVCRAAVVTEVGAWVTDAVRYRGTETEPVQRIVEQHWDENAVGLMVFNPTGLFMHSLNHACPRDDLPPRDKIVHGERLEYAGGTWHRSDDCSYAR